MGGSAHARAEVGSEGRFPAQRLRGCGGAALRGETLRGYRHGGGLVEVPPDQTVLTPIAVFLWDAGVLLVVGAPGVVVLSFLSLIAKLKC